MAGGFPLNEEDVLESPDLWWVLHPIVGRLAEVRLVDGHNADAVEAVLKEVNKRVKGYVKAKTGREIDGAGLMSYAFSLNAPVIILSDLDTRSGRDIQQGYMQIFAGAMTGIRNPKAHENLEIDRRRALHHLFLASLLMWKLDDAGVP